jgi:RNA polymerase sigma-70 factor (ECF subfamily)
MQNFDEGGQAYLGHSGSAGVSMSGDGGVPVDRESWRALLRRVAQRARGRADAEDLLHSAWLRLERYRTDHIIENPQAFLVRTAINIGIDDSRHERILPHDGDERAADIACDAPLQDEVIVARARLERVKEGLTKLTPRTREVFLMHRIEEMKYREIAQALGISQSAVEKHIARATLFLTEWTEGW